MKLLEKDIQRLITDWLTLQRIYWFRANRGAMKGEHKGKKWYVKFGTPGMSDLICILNGRFIAIEIKRPGNKQSDDQLQFMDDVRHAGGVYLLAYSLEDVISAMQEVQGLGAVDACNGGNSRRDNHHIPDKGDVGILSLQARLRGVRRRSHPRKAHGAG